MLGTCVPAIVPLAERSGSWDEQGLVMIGEASVLHDVGLFSPLDISYDDFETEIAVTEKPLVPYFTRGQYVGIMILNLASFTTYLSHAQSRGQKAL